MWNNNYLCIRHLFIILGSQLESSSFSIILLIRIIALSTLCRCSGNSLYFSICPCLKIRCFFHFRQCLAWIFCKGIVVVLPTYTKDYRNSDYEYLDPHKKRIYNIPYSSIPSIFMTASSLSSVLNMHRTILIFMYQNRI